MEVGWEFHVCREKSLRAMSPLVCLPRGLAYPEWQPLAVLPHNGDTSAIAFSSTSLTKKGAFTKAAPIYYPSKAFLLFEVQVCI